MTRALTGLSSFPGSVHPESAMVSCAEPRNLAQIDAHISTLSWTQKHCWEELGLLRGRTRNRLRLTASDWATGLCRNCPCMILIFRPKSFPHMQVLSKQRPNWHRPQFALPDRARCSQGFRGLFRPFFSFSRGLGREVVGVQGGILAGVRNYIVGYTVILQICPE